MPMTLNPVYTKDRYCLFLTMLLCKSHENYVYNKVIYILLYRGLQGKTITFESGVYSAKQIVQDVFSLKI